ncbi:MAG TPA: GDP-mannose 4,6-dehydratase [Acidimicrobiales bacterium]|jgi:GDP-4-dehydro-6-deoxy-D-mannose reductase|nr:GDP-mannose 4,6-dehydratase [Acidimicrobiales bacterium]
MKALVIGASGFVGRHLVDHLTDAGDDVDGIDRASGGPDICDSSAIRARIGASGAEVVYHLAGQSDVAASWSDPIGTYRANVEGLVNVLDGARDAGVRRVVAVLSADIYGHVDERDLPLTEDAPLRPISPYAASKAAADLVCLQAHLGYGMDVIRVRPFTHIGPGQSERFVASAIASRIVRAERDGLDSIPVGRLDARRDFTDVRDVVRAYRLLAEQGDAGEAYNICSGTDVSIQEVADSLVAAARRPLRLAPDPALQRPADIPVLRGDPARLHQLTGWKAEIPLATTLADLLDDWRARPRTAGTRAGAATTGE